jgi:hypothetical protein
MSSLLCGEVEHPMNSSQGAAFKQTNSILTAQPNKLTTHTHMMAVHVISRSCCQQIVLS